MLNLDTYSNYVIPIQPLFFTLDTDTPAFFAIAATALLWSSRFKNVKLAFGIFGQFLYNIKQLVLHGLATTTTLHVSLPTKFNASPYALKIFEFISINYDLSIPGYLAYPPRQPGMDRS